MLCPRRPRRPVASVTVRALIGGALMLGSIGSCELPKPQLPSIGSVPWPVRPTIVGNLASGVVAIAPVAPAGGAVAAIRADSAARDRA